MENNGLSQYGLTEADFDGLIAADFANKAKLALKKYENTEWWKFRERHRTYTLFKSFTIISLNRIISWREEIEYLNNNNE